MYCNNVSVTGWSFLWSLSAIIFNDSLNKSAKVSNNSANWPRDTVPLLRIPELYPLLPPAMQLDSQKPIQTSWRVDAALCGIHLYTTYIPKRNSICCKYSGNIIHILGLIWSLLDCIDKKTSCTDVYISYLLYKLTNNVRPVLSWCF